MGNSLKNKLKMKQTRVRESVRGPHALMFGSMSQSSLRSAGDVETANNEAEAHLAKVFIPLVEQTKEDNLEDNCTPHVKLVV